MRIVSYSPKPTNDVADFYDIALELVGAPPGVPLTCAAALASTEDETVIFAATSYADVATVTITPTTGPVLLLAWIIGAAGYTAGHLTPVSEIAGYTTLVNDACSRNSFTIASRQIASPSGGYTASATGDWDIVNGVWDGVPIAMQIAIHTDASAPVQDFYACASYGGRFAADPTPGNIILMMYHTEYPGNTQWATRPPTGWTTLYETNNDSYFIGAPHRSPEKAAQIGIYARCVTEEDNFTTATLFEGAKTFGYSTGQSIYVSEWAITGTVEGGGGGSDTVIDLGPTPGSTTTHTTDPTVTDDAAAGYTVGSTWINTTDGGVFVLVDSTTGAAVWVEVSPVPGTVYAPTTADYLVGTAQGGLSAEIVVGTTPGGELGGSWASPTVDATHSGSAHLALGSTSSTAAAGDHAHAGVYVGELLISDTPSTPLVFADILQNEAETDLMYAD